MSAVQDGDWTREVLRLKYGPQQMTSAEIAEAVGKHAATVRKVVARATQTEIAEVLASEAFSGPIPGQTTVDDHLPPEDDPDYTSDPLDDFKSEAGEAVGPMPPDPNPPEPIGYEARLAGTRQMALDFGAEELPVGGTLKLKSDKLASGFYGLGDVITGTFTARIVDVAGAERFQRASEEFRVQPQGHVALITEIALETK